MENKWISRYQLEKEIKRGMVYTRNSIKCANCGHTMLFARKNKAVCTWCGHYVFKDKKEEFEYRLKELL